MNKLLILLLVFTLSAMTTVRTDANFLQTLLAGMALVEKIEQFYQRKKEANELPTKRVEK